MLREIVLDTETTGLDPAQGHRVVEVAAVELIDHVPTGVTFQTYINPERDMPEEAFRIHGLAADFLDEFPVFTAIADDLCTFLGEAPLVIHNAVFDMRFLNAELTGAGRAVIPFTRAIDTLALAQRKFPGAANSLDALCRRFAIDASSRTLHGALLDCQLLAEVYLQLLGGRQTDLGLKPGARTTVAGNGQQRRFRVARPHAPSAQELARHEAFVDKLDDPVWRR